MSTQSNEHQSLPSTAKALEHLGAMCFALKGMGRMERRAYLGLLRVLWERSADYGEYAEQFAKHPAR
jgi:hypothetical protein